MKNWHRKLARTLALVALIPILGSAPVGLAGAADKVKPKVPESQGEPKGFQAGLPVRYAIWHGKHDWHLRTTTAKKLHNFKGSIQVEGGTFTKIHSHHLEKEGKLADIWLVNPVKNEVIFDFKTDKGIDGINFHVSTGAKALRFDLLIDGKHHPHLIFIGHGGHHPAHDPFTLPAHPHTK